LLAGSEEDLAAADSQLDLLLPPPRHATLPGGGLHANPHEKRVPDCMGK